ncbi:MAG: hypothetical protein IMZ60_04610, partial [Actinobacteria bacterium]|nr:hypothetical protein [Actinomycetota bacterium]
MIKKVIVAISIILVVLLSTTAFLYADNGKGNNNGNSNKQTFNITSSSNNGGTITPKGNQTVASDGSITFTISVDIDNGYELAWLRIDNAKIKNFTASSYTFDNVVKNHTIQAHFSKINNGNSNNSGGTITTEGNQPVQKGNGIASNTSKFFGFFHN